MCASLVCPLLALSQSTLGPQTGILVLRGGEVVVGAIRRSGDGYTVTFADQGEMRLPASAVEAHAADLIGAYRQLLANTDAGDAGRQLALAQWCLRQNLLQQAADRLLAASLLDPQHPEIAAVEARLRLAMHPSPEAAEPAPSPAAGKAAVARVWESVPSGAVESFTTVVQPLLLNRCAGCHRPGSGLSFQLLRPDSGRPVPRAFTERNLAAVLAVCDRGSPRESPLLEIPRSAHGGAKPIASAADAAQWERVAVWIEELSQPAEVRLAGEILGREGVLWQPSHRTAGESAASRDVPTALDKGDAPPDSKRTESAATPGNASSPRDPFDPEIFNRRHGK